MTQIAQKDVQHLAQLAQLQLDDNEIQTLTSDLELTLDYIESLAELDTQGVEPTYQLTDLTNVFREDEVQTSEVSREQLLSLAPESQDNQIKVPKVL